MNPTPPRCLTVLFQQATWKGNFRRDQKADNYLKHCWGQVLEVDGVKQQPDHESDPFLVKRRLLYYHCNCQGKSCDLLVIPRKKIVSIIHWPTPTC